jgi:hypothetical protein
MINLHGIDRHEHVMSKEEHCNEKNNKEQRREFQRAEQEK